jgi:transposase
MRAFSLDLRQRVVDALQSGQTRPQVSERFGVSLATIDRLARQWRQTQDLNPRPIPGRARAITETEREILQTLVSTQEDPTLSSLSKAWEEKTGKKISLSALQRNLVWLGYSHKKSHVSPPSETKRSDLRSWKPSPK